MYIPAVAKFVPGSTPKDMLSNQKFFLLSIDLDDESNQIKLLKSPSLASSCLAIRIPYHSN